MLHRKDKSSVDILSCKVVRFPRSNDWATKFPLKTNVSVMHKILISVASSSSSSLARKSR